MSFPVMPRHFMAEERVTPLLAYKDRGWDAGNYSGERTGIAGKTLGSASEGHLLVVVYTHDGGSHICEVNNTLCTEIEPIGTNLGDQIAFWVLEDFADTTGRVDVTPSEECYRHAYFIFRLRCNLLTPYYSYKVGDGNEGNTLSQALVDPGSPHTTIAATAGNDDGAIGWTNISERQEADIEGNHRASVASDQNLGAVTISSNADNMLRALTFI